jgi:uncharacterized protein YbjT (DUF2867 family)
MIVLTGATGKIGRELVRLLAAQGETVRALARRAGRGEDLPGIEWVAADLARREHLSEIFAGAEKLFLLTANSEDMVRLQKNAIKAARQAGVQQAWRIAALLAIASYQRAGGATEQTTPIVEELTGWSPRTFEQFARDHAAEFVG